MTTESSLKDLLPPEYQDLEWYDNSTLSTLDRCLRKGYWKHIFPIVAKDEKGELTEFKGIAEKVGDGAGYGTCIHTALDRFYAPGNASKTYEQRRILSLRAFTNKYSETFTEPEMVQSKYSHDRGLDILDMYFDHYQVEDQYYRVLDTEFVMINVIEPEPGENSFTPFVYIARTDGLIERLRYDDYFILEHKNVVSVDQELNKLRIGRQGEGYVWSAKQFPSTKGFPVNGVLANILAVRVTETDPNKLFYRDFIHKTSYHTDQWRLETIRKVERWRKLKQEASKEPTVVAAMLVFDRTTEECTRYGLCSYYDLCMHGPHSVDLSRYSPNTWNPLYTEKVELDD
jgi:hypothetical protein